MIRSTTIKADDKTLETIKRLVAIKEETRRKIIKRIKDRQEK